MNWNVVDDQVGDRYAIDEGQPSLSVSCHHAHHSHPSLLSARDLSIITASVSTRYLPSAIHFVLQLLSGLRTRKHVGASTWECCKESQWEARKMLQVTGSACEWQSVGRSVPSVSDLFESHFHPLHPYAFGKLNSASSG
jgi:hypothetical protein